MALSTTFFIFSMLLRRFIFFNRKYFAYSKSIIIFLPTIHSSANLKNLLTLQGYTFIVRFENGEVVYDEADPYKQIYYISIEIY